MTIDTRPSPLAPADLDLRSFPSMLLDVQRLRDSDLAAGDPAHLGLAVIAWAVSWHQLPAGSLPNDDAVLARLMGFGRDVKGWRKVRERALHAYVLCSDDRLYHPVVVEKAVECHENNKARSRKASIASQTRWSKARASAHAEHEQSTSNAQASTKHDTRAVPKLVTSTTLAFVEDSLSNANRTEQKVTEQKVKNQNQTSTSAYDAGRAEDDVREKRREEATDFTAKVVRAFERAGQTRHPITKLAYDWMLLPDFDFDAAIYVIEADLARPGVPKDIAGLKFFESQVIAKHEAKKRGYVGSGGAIAPVAHNPRKLVAREDAVCEGDKPLPDLTSHNMIDLWERGGPWAPVLGMRPDQRGCRVPSDILQARGYRDEAGRMSDRYIELRAQAREKRDLVRNSLEPILKAAPNGGATH